MCEQIPSVCERWTAELCLGHDQRRLERELVSQQHIEVEQLGALVRAQC